MKNKAGLPADGYNRKTACVIRCLHLNKIKMKEWRNGKGSVMKKTLTLLMIGLMVFLTLGVTNIMAQDAADIAYDYDELTVAGVTPTTGNFFCSLWGNVTSDMDVRMLLHGYNLVEFQSAEGTFAIDETVVSGIVVTADPAGNRTYTIALYNDLYYSDGSRITAWDYAFSMLLTMSPEIEEIGANVRRPEYIRGYSDYISGNVPYLAGVRVLADDQFSITVSADYLPFFYELGLLDCTPYPISVIAPGVRVADNGRGIYLTNAQAGGDPVFTADLLRQTILDPQNGYKTFPRISSGPYRLVSYTDGVVKAELNEYYKGDSHGYRPTIKRLTYVTLPVEEMVPALMNGDVALLNKVTNAASIADGVSAIAGSDIFESAAYPRTGLTFLSFNTERTAVSEAEVRQAIACAVDKDGFVAGTVGDYGQRVESYYGIGQWMYQLLTGELDLPIDEAEDRAAAEAAWAELDLGSIPHYDYDPEAAAALLESAGWNLNAQGGAYTDGIRYKNIGGNLVPLALTLAYPEASPAAPEIEALPGELSACGIGLTVSQMPLSDLLAQYYNTTERTYDMFFLGSNFDALFDPSASFETDENGEHVWTTSALIDEELYQYSVDMRRTEAGDLLAYCTHWLAFQQRFAELLPILPLYSNIYYDFYPRVLHDYDIAANLTWSQAVVPAYMSDVEEETVGN